MRRFVKWSWRILAGLLTLVILLLLGAYIAARMSLPDYDGRAALDGLSGEVTIVRDENAIPHIYAESDADAYFALGYVHAQDRLFQMEMMRRIGQGRLSEVRFIGRSGLRMDRFMRTMGFYRMAEQDYRDAPPAGKRVLDAYAAGVNAFLETRDGLLPPEFLLLGIDPEPWRPADSLVWGRLMAVQLSTNWRNELLRMRLIEAVGETRMRALWPDYPQDGVVTIQQWREAGLGPRFGERLERLWAALPHDMIGNGASNAWAVHGRLTDSGRPILANDPHLGMSAPTLWYFARIKTPTLDVTGVTVPGVPLHVLGHNGRVAWGFTTTYIDTDDLFLERVDPGDPNRYLTPDGPRAFETRRETIEISGGESVEIVIRSTRHGPVVSDLAEDRLMPDLPEGHVLALAAPWLRAGDRTAQALYDMNRAEDAAAFTEALRNFETPLQNILYADVNGTIAHYVPGLIPVRRNGDGFMPGIGWTGDHDWTGYIPFEERPHVINPRRGFIVNSNNRIVNDDYPYFLSHEWGDRFRAARVTDLLRTGTRPHTLDASASIQADHVSLMAREMLSLMTRTEMETEDSRRAVEMLRAWDGAMDRRRPEPLIFAAWLAALNARLYADELGGLSDRYLGQRADVVRAILTRHQGWCDDITTEDVREDCAAQIRAALDHALRTLRGRYGDRMGDWRWGEAHRLDAENRVLGFIPGLRELANLSIETDGGTNTVNKASYNIRSERPFAQQAGPGYRALFDLADLSRSRYILSTGQSGHFLSPHYGDMLERWRDVEYFRVAPTLEGARGNAVGTLTLVPAQ